MGELKPHPAQETVDISYEDREGNEYSETHGDPEKNLVVKTVAEKEDMLQPNEYGTTPDPTNPQLTEYEQNKREEVESATSPDSEKSDSASENKQADKPEDKSYSPGTPVENK